MNTDYIVVKKPQGAGMPAQALEVETMSVYAHDGPDLMLIVLAVAMLGLTVWAVSKLFPAKRIDEGQAESVCVPPVAGRARGGSCRGAMRSGGDAWEAREARRGDCHADFCLAQHPDNC
jgi:hypothetical protein